MGTGENFGRFSVRFGIFDAFRAVVFYNGGVARALGRFVASVIFLKVCA